jgi:hypothetical protein
VIGVITAGLFSSPTAPVTNSYESISTVTVGAGGQSSISFTSIPSTYKHLQIRAIGRYTVDNFWNRLIVNGTAMTNGGTSSSNYHMHWLYGDGANPGAQYNAQNYFFGSQGTVANTFSASIIDVLDYTNTNKNKVIRTLTGWDSNGGGLIGLNSFLFVNTAAVTSLSFTPDSGNWAQYSQFALYGIKG